MTNIDMLVCNARKDGTGGMLMKAMSEKFGKKYKDEQSIRFKGAYPGGIVVFSGKFGGFKHIAHAILQVKGKDPTKHHENVSQIFIDIMNKAWKKDVRSVALPLLGAGKP